MDEESLLLLMQLMFVKHDQRQKANFSLRRKGVPDKLRLQARYKGPSARQSLKEALQNAFLKEESRQRLSHQFTAQAFSTHTNHSKKRLQKNKNQLADN